MSNDQWQFRPPWWASVLTLVIVALFIQLSIWQWHRYHEKLRLREAYVAMLHASPKPLSTLEGKPFERVVVEGTYDSTHQFLLDNRLHAGSPGVEVLTPLKLSNGTAILVNRGFIPISAHRQIREDITPPTSLVRLTGIFMLPSKAFILGNVMTVAADKFVWPKWVMRVDPPILQAALEYPLLPSIILLDDQLPNGFVRQWAPPNFMAERSLGYCFQWAVLALAVLTVYFVMNFKRVKRNDEK